MEEMQKKNLSKKANKKLKRYSTMAKIIVKQIKSNIARPECQCKVLRSLGLGRIGKTKELEDTVAVRGMIAKVSHLIEIISK